MNASSNTVEPHPQVVADAATARAAVRLSSEYFLRSARLMTETTQGDLMKAVVLRAILAANIGHLDQNPNVAAQFSGVDSPPPDDLRRPVSVLSVAGSLGLPFETTRRYVNKLIREGRCVRVKGGVLAPAATLDSPEQEQALLLNLANLRRLFRGLKRAGVDLE
ncbi:hypothetical protein ACO2Q3_26285 [Caulobacter sp. KR2-114]|uniref:hypothetical protein n=1 Tax=Caulobacter sp. KR2-114 TaxID=3400912 RepID=UPI003BFCE11B